MYSIPIEITDQVVNLVLNPSPIDDRYTLRPHTLLELSLETSAQLKILRLVNKSFCKSASRSIFRVVSTFIRTGTHNEKPIHRSLKSLENLWQLSISSYASHVRKVLVQLDTLYSLSGPEQDTYVQHLCVILPCCLRAFGNLEALEFCGPYDRLAYERNALFSENSRSSIHTILRFLLQSSLVCRLDDLTIKLPVTHDFAALGIPMFGFAHAHDQMRLVRHIRVEVTDNSGSFGQRYYSSQPTKIQSEFPNTRFAKAFFDFISRATELETLEVYCTHVLDLDLLDTQRYRTLRILSLSRIKVSSHHLISVITKNRESLRSVQLSLVELKDGSWEEVLRSFCSAMSLMSFWMDSCSYDRKGQSATRGSNLLPPIDDPIEIETLHFEDSLALGYVKRHVNDIRSACGKLPMTDYDYRHIAKLQSFQNARFD